MAPAKTTKASSAKSSPQLATNSDSEPHTDRVARRAYERWCERGCPHGTDLQDWFDAEHEVLNGKSSSQRK